MALARTHAIALVGLQGSRGSGLRHGGGSGAERGRGISGTADAGRASPSLSVLLGWLCCGRPDSGGGGLEVIETGQGKAAREELAKGDLQVPEEK
jgi:hypothetical protein